MFLHFYQEKSLINKLLLVNRETLKYDERIFYSFMDGLKFYHFFIMYSGTRKSYKNPIDFLHMETKIDTYIRKKIFLLFLKIPKTNLLPVIPLLRQLPTGSFLT